MGISNEYKTRITNKVIKPLDNCNPIMKSNNKYLGAFYDNKIIIYDLDPPNFNLTIENSIICKEDINYIDFNPEYPEIIMSALSEGDVKLWNISNKKDNHKEICIFKGHSSSVRFALFNPTISTKVISSDNKNIKLWDINKYSNDFNVVNEEYINKLKWNFFGNKYGYISGNNKLVINKVEENKNLLTIHEKDMNDFIFNGYSEIITFHNNRIKRWDMRKFNFPVKIYENVNIASYLYDNNLNYLYSIEYNRINIYKTNDFEKKEQELEVSDLTRSNKIILLDSCFLKNNEISNILDLNGSYSRIIKITKKGFLNQQNDIHQPQKNLNEYLKKIVYKISDVSELLKHSKNIQKDEDGIIITQKYLEIPELSDEFKSIEKQSIFQRKSYVKNKIKENIKDIKNSKDKCIFYLKLLIRDNSNIKLIKEYLSFLKTNPQLETLNLDYQKELQYYMVSLTKSELNELKEKKINSEKDNLIQFLNNLCEVKNSSDFYDIKTKIIQDFKTHSFFNQPIGFENPELFFYKSKMNLYYGILKLGSKEYYANFKTMQNFIKIILDKNYFNNNDIIKNEEILDLLIFSISNIKNENIEIYGDFLNLIEGKKENNDYNQLLKKMKAEINYNDIKDFLKSILKKRTIKELISFLFGDKYCSNFTEEYINTFVDNFLKFVPFNDVDTSGFTDRFTLQTYILLDQDIYDKDIFKIKSNYKDKVAKVLKIGRVIVIILHELSHNFYFYTLEYYNYANLTFESSRKKLCDIDEVGFYAELILFGRVINNINLEEVLFLIDEDNYNKDLKNFQKDFVNLKGDKKIIGIFDYFNDLKKNEFIIDYKNMSIKTKSSPDEDSYKNPSIRIEQRGNCIIGSQRKIDIDLINDYFKKYNRIEAIEKIEK